MFWCRMTLLLSIAGSVGWNLNYPLEASTASQAQMPSERNHSRHTNAQPDPELQSILNEVDAVSPEFGADILIRVAENPKIADKSVKIQMLRKAFRLSQNAHEGVKRARMSVMNPDTETGYSAIAFLMGLDSLSLQSRVVVDLLSLDPMLAKSTEEEIHLSDLSPVPCSNPLTYDVSAFYQAVGSVARLTLTQKEGGQNEALALIAPLVVNLKSHAQVPPAAELLLSAGLDRTELFQGANEFAYALANLSGDPRGFVGANAGEERSTVIGAVARLVDSLEKRGMPASAVMKGLRAYIVINLNGERCADDVDPKQGLNALPAEAVTFNQVFRSAIENRQTTPITIAELTSARVGDGPALVEFWQSEDKNLLNGLRQLRIERQSASSDAANSAWISHLRSFLSQLETWEQNDKSSTSFFDEKSILYEALIDLAPTGERDPVIKSFVNFLELNSIVRDSPIEWLFEVRRLLTKSRKAAFRDELLQAFSDSRDVGLNLYARFEVWAPSDAEIKPRVATP